MCVSRKYLEDLRRCKIEFWKTVKGKYRDNLILTDSDQMVIEGVHKLYTQLDVHTITLGGAEFVACSIVIHVMKSMQNCLKPNDNDPQFIVDLKAKIFSQFEERTKQNLNFTNKKNKLNEREAVFKKF